MTETGSEEVKVAAPQATTPREVWQELGHISDKMIKKAESGNWWLDRESTNQATQEAESFLAQEGVNNNPDFLKALFGYTHIRLAQAFHNGEIPSGHGPESDAWRRWALVTGMPTVLNSIHPQDQARLREAAAETVGQKFGAAYIRAAKELGDENAARTETRELARRHLNEDMAAFDAEFNSDPGTWVQAALSSPQA